jgi:hypothetical protein
MIVVSEYMCFFFIIKIWEVNSQCLGVIFHCELAVLRGVL